MVVARFIHYVSQIAALVLLKPVATMPVFVVEVFWVPYDLELALRRELASLL